MSNQLLDLSPSAELRFTGPRRIARLSLTNCTDDSQVAFKIKSTCPKQFSIKPSLAALDPGQSVEVVFRLRKPLAMSQFEEHAPPRFRVISIVIEPPLLKPVLPASVDAVIKMSKSRDRSKSKLTCMFDEDDDDSRDDEPGEERGGDGQPESGETQESPEKQEQSHDQKPLPQSADSPQQQAMPSLNDFNPFDYQPWGSSDGSLGSEQAKSEDGTTTEILFNKPIRVRTPSPSSSRPVVTLAPIPVATDADGIGPLDPPSEEEEVLITKEDSDQANKQVDMVEPEPPQPQPMTAVVAAETVELPADVHEAQGVASLVQRFVSTSPKTVLFGAATAALGVSVAILFLIIRLRR